MRLLHILGFLISTVLLSALAVSNVSAQIFTDWYYPLSSSGFSGVTNPLNQRSPDSAVSSYPGTFFSGNLGIDSEFLDGVTTNPMFPIEPGRVLGAEIQVKAELDGTASNAYFVASLGGNFVIDTEGGCTNTAIYLAENATYEGCLSGGALTAYEESLTLSTSREIYSAWLPAFLDSAVTSGSEWENGTVCTGDDGGICLGWGIQMHAPDIFGVVHVEWWRVRFLLSSHTSISSASADFDEGTLSLSLEGDTGIAEDGMVCDVYVGQKYQSGFATYSDVRVLLDAESDETRATTPPLFADLGGGVFRGYDWYVDRNSADTTWKADVVLPYTAGDTTAVSLQFMCTSESGAITNSDLIWLELDDISGGEDWTTGCTSGDLACRLWRDFRNWVVGFIRPVWQSADFNRFMALLKGRMPFGYGYLLASTVTDLDLSGSDVILDASVGEPVNLNTNGVVQSVVGGLGYVLQFVIGLGLLIGMGRLLHTVVQTT